MQSSIRQIFFNFRTSLLIIGLGMMFLSAQLINISQHSDRLSALKNQHILIKKIIATDLNDTQMASITINSALSELALFVKNSNNKTLFEGFISSNEEQKSLYRALESTSVSFQESALFWSESMLDSRLTMYDRMISARNLYLIDIDVMIDFQINRINESITMAKTIALMIFIFGIFIFIFYQWRLNQIYRDIKSLCSIDFNSSQPKIFTEEIDYLARRIARKPINNNPTLLNPISGINNEKGMVSSYNMKRNTKNIGSLFLAHFEIDQHEQLSATLSKETMNTIYIKIADILSMYEQPLDVIAHLEDNTFAYLMARNSKDLALSEAEKIVASLHDSLFQCEHGNLKITLSAGFMLKAPSKTLEEALSDISKITEKAKESGGNRVAQLREIPDSFR